MVDFWPEPFANLVTRAFLEYRREKKIFELPASKFYVGTPGLDTSVTFQGRPAATPAGPAAGPQTQLTQNLVLSWLAGGRILELKTVQLKDDLDIPRPCIHIPNIGYNIEWSQELKVEQSLRQYVGASMLIEMLLASGIPPFRTARGKKETQLDLSVGYELEGIRSPTIRRFIEQMKDASGLVEELRAQLPRELGELRDLPFTTRIATNITLSTFHGCPADEIESIVAFLLTEMDLDVCIKMNPTLLGREKVEWLLHELLGYDNVQLNTAAFERELQFDAALDLVSRLLRVAHSRGRRLAVKLSNTLETINTLDRFPESEKVMYLSGEPLHVIAMTLLGEWRRLFGVKVPVSFAAGADETNFPDLMGLNLTPITSCTDLLRPGGYARLAKYLLRLEEAMQQKQVSNLGDYVVTCGGHGEEAIGRVMGDVRGELAPRSRNFPEGVFDHIEAFLAGVQDRLKKGLESDRIDLRQILEEAAEQVADTAGLPPEHPELTALRQALRDAHALLQAHAGVLNTPELVKATQENPRYSRENNKKLPRRRDSRLELFDCRGCRKCVAVCPNNANFPYEVQPAELECEILTLSSGEVLCERGSLFRIKRRLQTANYADFCNQCGNCDTFCSETGSPYLAKPRFFSRSESYLRYREHDGFWLRREGETAVLHGRIRGREYFLRHEGRTGKDVFSDGALRVEVEMPGYRVGHIEVLRPELEGHQLDLWMYHAMRLLLLGVLNEKRINYVNTPFV